jgi:hypothetical protein
MSTARFVRLVGIVGSGLVSAVIGCGGDIEIRSNGRALSSGGAGGIDREYGIAMRSTSPWGIGGAGNSSVSLAAGGYSPRYFVMDAEERDSYRSIVFASLNNRCHWVASESSSREKHPAFSPNGRELAYASDESGRFQIHLRNLDTGRVLRVTDLAKGATYPSWSPDGVSLVGIEGDHEANPGEGERMFVIDVHTGHTAWVELGGDGNGYFSPRFARPDLIVVGNGKNILGASLDGGIVVLVSPERSDTDVRDPTPSPDGMRFAYSDSTCPAGSILLANLDGRQTDACLQGQSLGEGLLGAVAPAWGPFQEFAVETPQGVTIIHELGGPPRWVYSEPELRLHNPAWAPLNFSVPCH